MTRTAIHIKSPLRMEAEREASARCLDHIERCRREPMSGSEWANLYRQILAEQLHRTFIEKTEKYRRHQAYLLMLFEPPATYLRRADGGFEKQPAKLPPEAQKSYDMLEEAVQLIAAELGLREEPPTPTLDGAGLIV